MKIYWDDPNRRSEILEDIDKNKARPWDASDPKSHILVGNGHIFIHPPDYHIVGYSLSADDLRALLKKLRAKLKAKTSTQAD